MYIYLGTLKHCMEPYVVDAYLDDYTGQFIDAKDLPFEDKERFISIPKYNDKKIFWAYICQLHDKQYKKILARQFDDPRFVSIFHDFIQVKGLYNDYHSFYRTETTRIAAEWCDLHNIKYTTRADERK